MSALFLAWCRGVSRSRTSKVQRQQRGLESGIPEVHDRLGSVAARDLLAVVAKPVGRAGTVEDLAALAVGAELGVKVGDDLHLGGVTSSTGQGFGPALQA